MTSLRTKTSKDLKGAKILYENTYFKIHQGHQNRCVRSGVSKGDVTIIMGWSHDLRFSGHVMAQQKKNKQFV